MKIVDMILVRCTSPLSQPFKTALRTVHAVDSIVVKLIGDTGLIGWGEAAPTLVITGDSLGGIYSALNEPLRHVVVGREIEELEAILVDVERAVVGNTSAKAAIDMALYDLFCQRYQLPLFRLLGGTRSEIETDMTISVDKVEQMTHTATQRVASGFTTLKIKVGKDWKNDLARIRSIREAVGPDIAIRVDANQGWTPKQAVHIIAQMEKHALGVELVEQPVARHDIDGLAFVTHNVATPIMADESLFSARDAVTLLQRRAVDLLNIKLMKCGGIRQALHIVGIAEAYDIACMVGSMMESKLSVTAAAHLAAAKHNIAFTDLDAPLWLARDLAVGGITYDGKRITLPAAPGLGITALRDDAIVTSD